MRSASTGSEISNLKFQTNTNTRKGIEHMNENQPPPDSGAPKELLLFQMGPVQEFIAQAATPSDLWAGSYLLSELVLAGIRQIPDYKNALVFPNLSDGTVEDAMENGLVPSIPNRFLAVVPERKGRTIAETVKASIGKKLECYGKCLPVPGAVDQVRQFLQMTWAVLSEPSGDMGEDYKAVGRLLAKRRNLREFEPWRENECTKTNGLNGPKDFLSGKESALKFGRGAMNLLKLMVAMDHHKHPINIGTEDDSYLAVIALDGDKMGATLSNLKSEDEHRRFSKRLAEFAREAAGLIEAPGVLMYAGGDDVLAAVPAKKAIDTAKNLAAAFATKLSDFKWKDENGEHSISASAGIAVGHEATPVLDLVNAARAAEHRAKTLYGRNALALSVFKRSGEILEWGCNWNSAALDLHSEIVESLRDELSARFPYKLAAFLTPYELDGDSDPEMEKVVLKELENVWERSPAPEVSETKDEKAKPETPAHKAAKAYLCETFEKKRPQDFLNLFLCETFVNRQRNGED